MMRRRGYTATGGFSLVELIVVLAIIGILSSIAIGVTSSFSQNAMDRGARSLYSLLRAARVYAATYKVNTAVVYQLDNSASIEDSIKRVPVNTIRAAAIMYELPSDMGFYAGKYVPSPKFGGDFEPFSPGYALLLDVPPDGPDKVPGPSVHDGNGPLPTDRVSPDRLGMRPVALYTGSISEDPAVRQGEYDPAEVVLYLAHVFKAGGTLDADGPAERFRVLYAPSPERPLEERLWSSAPVDDTMLPLWLNNDPTTPEMGMIGIPIEIFRSTGRVVMGEL